MNYCKNFGVAGRLGLRGWACVVGLCKVMIGCALAQAAGIVPDGATVTSVSANSAGRSTVAIAPAQYDVLQNTYSSFNVSSAGATLNNTGINARTIVHQVTGNNLSLIASDITVAGPRANVVVADPGCITINGEQFINTGHVALSTGWSNLTMADVLWKSAGSIVSVAAENTDQMATLTST